MIVSAVICGKMTQTNGEKYQQVINSLEHLLRTTRYDKLQKLVDILNGDIYLRQSEEEQNNMLEKISVCIEPALKKYPMPTLNSALTVRVLMNMDPSLTHQDAIRRAKENPLVLLPHLC